MQTGTVRLENSERYPFNNSAQTVALAQEQENTDYAVSAELLCTDGSVGEIRVSGKAVNGFQIAFTGSASFAELRWRVTGGAE